MAERTPASELTVMTGADPGALATTIERLAATYTAPPWVEEMGRARREFDGLRGKVYEDDGIFENHLLAFLEWYVLERALEDGQPPVVLELRRAAAVCSGSAPRGREDGPPADPDLQVLRALALSYRSLFEVVDSLASSVRVHDLIRGGLWAIETGRPLDGFDPGILFEGRLCPWEGGVRFGPVFFFHPQAARESVHAVLAHASAEGKLEPGLIHRLAEMRLKHDRFRNIAIDRIYSLSWRGPAGREEAGR